jgi:hypothetical protein
VRTPIKVTKIKYLIAVVGGEIRDVSAGQPGSHRHPTRRRHAQMAHASSVQTGESSPCGARRKEKTTTSSWAVEIPISASESSRGGALALSVVGLVVAEALKVVAAATVASTVVALCKRATNSTMAAPSMVASSVVLAALVLVAAFLVAAVSSTGLIESLNRSNEYDGRRMMAATLSTAPTLVSIPATPERAVPSDVSAGCQNEQLPSRTATCGQMLGPACTTAVWCVSIVHCEDHG